MVIDNGAYVSWGSTTPYVMLSTVAGLYRCPAVVICALERHASRTAVGAHA